MKWLKYLAIFLFLFVLTIATINTGLFDEKPHPEVERLINDNAYPPIQGNAFFAFIGLSTAEDKDIAIAGHDSVQKYLKLESASEPFDYIDFDTCPEECNKKHQERHKRTGSCNHKDSFNCLTSQSQKETSVDAYTNLMLERYKQLIQLKQFKPYNNFKAMMPLKLLTSNRTAFRSLSKIYLTNSYRSNSGITFLRDLQKENKFMRMMLSQSLLLTDKIIPKAHLKTHIHYLSEFIRNHELNSEKIELIRQMILPLPKKDLDLTSAFMEELKASFKINYIYEHENNFLFNLLFQPNASNNDSYEQSIQALIPWSQMTIPEIYLARKNKIVFSEKPKLQFNYIYNPIGKLLNHYSRASYGDYVVVLHDLNNMMKLLDVQLQIQQAGVENADFILSQEHNYNPYDGQAFQFDKNSNTIGFDCLMSFDSCKLKIAN